MLTNETRKPITKLTCISEPDATRRHFRKIFLSYLCGPHQVYQNSDLRIVHIGYHDSCIFAWSTSDTTTAISRIAIASREL